MLIFDEQLLVEIPNSFREMEKSKIDMMYPYEERPQIILEDEKRFRFCTFSLLEAQKLSDSQVECAACTVMETVTSLYPSCLLEESQMIDSRGGTCGWFSFMTSGEEEKLYNVMYIFPVNGCMMLGTMGCFLTDLQGRRQMMKIMDSLEVHRKKLAYTVLTRRTPDKTI